MKIYLGLIAAATLVMTACAPDASKTAAPAAPASAAPAASEAAPAASEAPAASATAEASATAPAADVPAECSITITSDDAMKFEPKEIAVKSSCKQYQIVLKHVGKMPKAAMGHNVVITATANKDAVLKDGSEAGLDKDYVKPGDTNVIAHTKLIGGGEETSVTFDTSKLTKDGAYEYFCSFPGHYAQMHGTIKLVD